MAPAGPNPSIVMSAPPNVSGASSHPRRAPAKHSMSLLHASKPQPTRLRKQTTASSSDSGVKRSPSGDDSAGTNTPPSLQALGGKTSSGESSNAERWFEKSNNEVKENSAPFADNDPPFFMRNSSSSETPPDLRQRMNNVNPEDGTNSLPLRTGLLQLGTTASSSEDFRGVIDDLTIENNRLKRRLKKYEKLHDSHLKDEKLFEVRIHGLPSEKKKELEETLRKFASSLSPSAANAFPSNGYAGLLPMSKGARTASSPTSLAHADSAYASISASGQGSSVQWGSETNPRIIPSQHPAARRQNIQNYLHHIPEGLFSQQNPTDMTERAKKKLVVRRMEQIFAGKGASAGGHQQSIQQQEVSQSAARTDRTAMEADGQRTRREGSREAHIMDRETEDPLDIKSTGKRRLPDPHSEPQWDSGNVVNQDFAEQRPTRPLDLDPHRAQFPAENMRYLRRMGFSPLDPESSTCPEDGHGWIYLNFLTNMAQLHTINVTDDFVRKALSDYSQKFELSNDGRRVRWKGDNSFTWNSSSGEASSHDRTTDNTPDLRNPPKRFKLSHGEPVPHSGGFPQRWQPENNRFAYTPLFFHRENSEEADESSSEEEDNPSASSPFLQPIAGGSSRMTSSGIRTGTGMPLVPRKKKQKHDNGPIIFYNNARFCTDLSGDRKSQFNHSARDLGATNLPIGKASPSSDEDEGFEKRGLLAHASELPEPMDLTDNPIPNHMELSFPESSSARSEVAEERHAPNFEVSGVGGVWPVDNFSITVQSRVARVDPSNTSNVSTGATQHTIPPRLAKIIRGTQSEASSTRPRIQKEVLESKVRELPPSELPPALNFMAFGEDSEDDQSDSGENESEASESPGALPPSAAPQPVAIAFESSDEEDDDDDEEEEDDGEVDFLAGLREVDPEAVREREREYDANMAERLAEDIPVGSSAATVGGRGSGFASPADGVTREEYMRAKREVRKGSVTSRCARASDSMIVNHMKDSSSDESSSADDGEMSNARS